MNRIDPNDINIHFELPPEWWSKNNVVAIDSEFFNQDVNKLHRPHGDFACVGCTHNGRDVYMIFDSKEIQEFYNRIKEPTHVYHNAFYDLTQLRPYADITDRKRIWDTMLIEQIRFNNYYDSFALNDLARRYLNIYISKDERKTFSFNEDGKMSDKQIQYAAIDIVATWLVAQEQMNQIDEDDTNVWKHIERDFLWTLLDNYGIPLDVDKWTARYTKDKEQRDDLDESLPFNPRSHTQVKEYFLTKYGIKMTGTAEKIISKLIEKHPDIPELALILEDRGATKASSTYGASWVKNLENGLIYVNWKQIGAVTGRMSAPNPFAIQTMPHDPSYRECIICGEDEVMVINDYSSQEPRILAYVTQEEKLIQIFVDDKDVYIAIGYEIFDEIFDKKDPRRKDMKSIVLGVSYGLTKTGMVAKLNEHRKKEDWVTEDYCQELLDLFFEKFPQTKAFVDECAIWKPYVTTILGRKYWGNPYKFGWERNYQNHPMQGSAVDCTKIAATKLRKALGYNPCRIYMHDELVCIFKKSDAERGAKLMTQIMVETQEWMHPGIPGGVEQGIGTNWSAKP